MSTADSVCKKINPASYCRTDKVPQTCHGATVPGHPDQPIYCCNKDSDCVIDGSPITGTCVSSSCSWAGKSQPPPIVPGAANIALPRLTTTPHAPATADEAQKAYELVPKIDPSVKPMNPDANFRMTLWHEGVVGVTKMDDLTDYYASLTNFLTTKKFDRCFVQVMDPGATQYNQPTFPYAQPEFILENYLKPMSQGGAENTFVAGALLYVNPMTPILLEKNGTFTLGSDGKTWVPNPATKGMFHGLPGGIQGNNPDYIVNPDGCGNIYRDCNSTQDPYCFQPTEEKQNIVCTGWNPPSLTPGEMESCTGGPPPPSPPHYSPSPSPPHYSPSPPHSPSPPPPHSPSPHSPSPPSPPHSPSPSPPGTSCGSDPDAYCQSITKDAGTYCQGSGGVFNCHGHIATPCCAKEGYCGRPPQEHLVPQAAHPSRIGRMPRHRPYNLVSPNETVTDPLPALRDGTGGCIPGHDSLPVPDGGCNKGGSGEICLLNQATGQNECTLLTCGSVKDVCAGKMPGTTPGTTVDVPPCCVQFAQGCPNNIEQMINYIGYVNKLAKAKGYKQITAIAFDGEDLGLYGAGAWGMMQVWQAIRRFAPEIVQAGFAHGPGASSCSTYSNIAFPEMYWIGELKPPPGQSIIDAQTGPKWSPGYEGYTTTVPPILIPSGNASSCQPDAQTPGCIWCANVDSSVKLSTTTTGGVCCEFCKTSADSDYGVCMSGAQAVCAKNGPSDMASCVAGVQRDCLLCANCRQAIYVQHQNKPKDMLDAFRPFMKGYMQNVISPAGNDSAYGTCPLFSLENAHTDLQSGSPQGCVQTHYNDGDPSTTFCGTFDGFGCWDWDKFMDFLNMYACEVYSLVPERQSDNKAGKFYIDIGIYEWQFVPSAWTDMPGGGRNTTMLGALPSSIRPNKPWFWVIIAIIALLVGIGIWWFWKKKHV